MKTGYSYAILVENTPDRYLWQKSTYLPNNYKKTKYGLIIMTINRDHSELISHINYSNNLQKLIKQMKEFGSWYDYVNGFMKCMQGYLSEI
jgi:hypothetical protein